MYKYNHCHAHSPPLVHCVEVCTYCGRSPDQVLQLGVAELQADDVIELVSLRWRSLIVTSPLGHGHLCPLLSAHIHHIYHASAT